MEEKRPSLTPSVPDATVRVTEHRDSPSFWSFVGFGLPKSPLCAYPLHGIDQF